MALGRQKMDLLETSFIALMVRYEREIEQAKQVGDLNKATNLKLERMRVRKMHLQPTTKLIED